LIWRGAGQGGTKDLFWQSNPDNRVATLLSSI